MAENTELVEDQINAKQGVNISDGPQTSEGVLDNSRIVGDSDNATERTAMMEVNANAEINANPELNANLTVDSNANAPSRTDSDKDAIEQDSLENIEPLPEPQEPVQDEGSGQGEVKEQPNEPQEDIQAEGHPESGQLDVGQSEGGQQHEMQIEEAGIRAEDAEIDAPGEVQEEVLEDASSSAEELEIPHEAVEVDAPVGETDEDDAEGYQEEETYDEGDLVEGVTEEPLEEPFSPAFSESKTFDIIDTDRDFESEVCRYRTLEPDEKYTPELVDIPDSGGNKQQFATVTKIPDGTESKGTADATHEDLNTTNTSDDRPPRQRKEPVLDASKLKEREERNANNRRAHLQKKSDVLKDKNEQRRQAVEERRRQQAEADKERKEAILQKSKEREEASHSSREKRRSWSAFGARESPTPIQSASTPRGRSTDRAAPKSRTTNLSSSKHLSSSVSNIYQRSVKLVRLGPNEDDWFQMYVPEKSKKKPGSPAGAVTPPPAASGAGPADARSPVGALRSSPSHYRSTPNLASSYKRPRPKAFSPRDTKSSHSTPTHGPRPSAAAVTERLSRPKPGMKSPSSSTTNLSTPSPSSTSKRAPSPRTVGRPQSPRQRTPLSARSSNASNASNDSQTSAGSTTPKRAPSPRTATRDKSSDSHSSGKTPSNKSTSSNPPPIKKALTPSAGVVKPTPTKPGQTTRPKSSTPAKKDSPTTPGPVDKPKSTSTDKPKAPPADKPKATPAEKPKPAPAATKASPAPAAPAAEKPKASEAKQNGSDNGDKTELTAEERAKQALAERRRQAREKAEREAELEKQRQEQLRIEEEERKKKAEEERLKAEQEALRLAEELRLADLERQRQEEEDRMREMAEEKQRQEEEERMREEEEKKKQEEMAKKEEERKKQEEELAAKHKKEEEERDARRKRVDEIMKRARRGAQNKDESSQPGSPDSEKSTDSQGKTNGINSSSMLLNDKYRNLLSGNRNIGSNPVSGDEDSSEDLIDQVEGGRKGSDAAAISDAPGSAEETVGATDVDLIGGGGDGLINPVSQDNIHDANTGGEEATIGGGDAIQEEEGSSVDGDVLLTEEAQKPSEPEMEVKSSVVEQEEPAPAADAESGVVIATDDASNEQIVEESSADVPAEAAIDNGSQQEASISENSHASPETDSIEHAKNGQMDQESSLVIDPKDGVDSSLLIEHPAGKTEIEITNGEGGLMDHGNGDSGVEDGVKVGFKFGHSPEDSGIEGNNQSGAVLTSEI
ncbi:titin homolog [Lytechinus variegatus]|uniref:titin homolog n=1 Tax=Lytechinus variegatus TaxID=7654 RepID=UPI001BB1F77B|nr:titin homolog [Lytechinus variegatus]